MVDLDHFKSVNDEHGHQVGDIVIQETVRWIERILRPYDIFARYGGEEFIIFLSDIDKKSALHVTERIRALIEESEITQKGKSFNVTASLGVAAAAPVNNLNDAIALADGALYKAKQDGRNRVCFAD
jgi:diguanylate cyclase (GGDEF)-like protein